jgi:hypothetical protein
MAPDLELQVWNTSGRRLRTVDLIMAEAPEVVKFQEVKPWVTAQGHR